MSMHRRDVLRAAGIAFLGAGAIKPAFAFAATEARSLAFNNLWTGEKVSVDYWAQGAYVPDALRRIDAVLRDFRTGDVHPIEPKLLDLLCLVRRTLESDAPFEVISAFRSPKTNAMLHEKSTAVASNSLHMDGRAIDVRVPGRALSDLRATALSLRAGGVGYYPKDKFVHLDVGRVRNW